MTHSRQKIAQTAALAGAALFLAALALFAAAGLNARLWADDFCYSATIKQMGLLRGIADWYRVNGNRLSTLVPVAMSDLFGADAARFIPGVVMGLWALALFFFLRRLARLLGKEIPAAWPALLALATAYHAVLLAPDRLQTVYWRMGVFHYSLPIPLLLLNLGLVAGWLRGNSSAWGLLWRCLAAGLLALFSAGLSETAAAMQAGVLLTGLALALLFLAPAERRRAAFLLGAGLLGTLVMMAVMSQAPANAWRQEAMPPPENPLVILPVSLRFAADFAFFALRGRPTAYLAFCLLAFAAGLVAFAPAGSTNTGARLPLWRLLAGAALSLLAAYAWIVFSFAPSVFAGLQYPAGRAQMPGHFALLAGLAAASLFAAGAVLRLLNTRASAARFAIALALLALACLYPIRALPLFRQDLASLSVRAQRWDARAAEIRAAAASGGRAVKVQQVDVVQGLEDIGPNPAFWINRCAAVYWGVSRITAEE